MEEKDKQRMFRSDSQRKKEDVEVRLYIKDEMDYQYIIKYQNLATYTTLPS